MYLILVFYIITFECSGRNELRSHHRQAILKFKWDRMLF